MPMDDIRQTIDGASLACASRRQHGYRTLKVTNAKEPLLWLGRTLNANLTSNGYHLAGT